MPAEDVKCCVSAECQQKDGRIDAKGFSSSNSVIFAIFIYTAYKQNFHFEKCALSAVAGPVSGDRVLFTTAAILAVANSLLLLPLAHLALSVLESFQLCSEK